MKNTQKANLSFCKNLLLRCAHQTNGDQERYRFLHSWLLCGLLIVGFVSKIYAQADTLTVRGKVENLTVRLYRQAPEISVARLNILQSANEIVRGAQLRPDGSFELKMPLVYPLEECYLTYANVVVPFLGEKGNVEVTLNGDSLTTSDVPLHFQGIHAATNNRHAQFYAAFNKWLKANPEKPIKTNNALSFWEKISLERDRKIAFYRSFTTSKDALLDQWVISSLNDAAKAKLYNFLFQQTQTLPMALTAAAELDTNRFLTFAKADSYQQFNNYAFVNTPGLSESSLPVNKIASLILQYVSNISSADSLKLASYVKGETAKMRDLKWLSNLFNQKEDTLKLISVYELYARKYGAAYTAKELDYLKAAFYSTNVNSFTLKNLTLWYDHLRPSLKNPYYVRSLDELHRIQNLDSAAIREANRKIIPNDDKQSYYDELVPNLWAYQDTYKDGEELWGDIRKKTKGKIIYVIFWTNDELGRRALAESRELRAYLPEDKVAFVYLCEHKDNEEVWLETIIKTKARGLHVKLEELQTDYLASIWEINRVPFCVLVDANGKYIKRDAPLPADREGWNKIWDKVVR
ncbi:hypothetical protein [Runella sp.]|uniref:hypothetical protein n=1 Tax=Runella sp. TaxID=1960881 RepID=UPI003D0ED926